MRRDIIGMSQGERQGSKITAGANRSLFRDYRTDLAVEQEAELVQAIEALDEDQLEEDGN